MGVGRNLNAIPAASARAVDLEPIQIESNALGVDLDAASLSYSKISREIIGARLVNNEVVIRIRGVDAGRSRRGLEIGSRLYFIQPFHRRGGRAWRGKAALRKGRRNQNKGE